MGSTIQNHPAAKWALKALQSRPDLLAAGLITLVVFMMIVPLPKPVVDAAIALNFSVAVLLVALATYVPNPLAFSTFPVLLLIVTAFRLAISISTTRLVLLEADAGEIVEAFGTFVVSGNLVVGLVMFSIITIVQFLVVTKGAERIAEVSARFSLDSLPGKQLSIDADLRAGFIDATEARRKRTELSRESQLFGAMDGTMKFVKGDAIAGLIIVAINLVGGFAVGILQHDLQATESLHIYSVLTIGDGLIAQIPALLIALSAGLLIARVTPEQIAADEASVGREITKQILSEPKAWLFASGVILIFGFLPGMPLTMFAAIALAAGLVGLFQVRGAQKRVVSHLELCETGDENLRAINPNTPLILRIAPQSKGDPVFEHFIRRCRQIRNKIVSDFGITLPSLTVEFHVDVDVNEMHLCVYETPQLRVALRPGQLAWRLNQHDFTGPPTDIVERSQLPKPQLREQGWFWIDGSAEAELQNSNFIVRRFEDFFDERVQTTFFEQGAQFIGMQEVRSFIAWLDREVPELAKELQRTFPNAKLCYLLQALAKERVPVRNFRLIGEVLVAGGLQDRDPEVVIDYLRRALRDEILSRYAVDGSIRVCLLHPGLEATLRESLRETPVGSTFDLPPVDLEQLLLLIHSHIYAQGSLIPQGVCVVQQDLRRPLWEAASTLKHFLPVIAFPEMSPSYEVEVVGRVDWQFETAPAF